MARKPDQKLKKEILDRILLALSRKGLHNLSLRGIGREIGISDRMLVFHFKTYENLINSVFLHLSLRHKTILREILIENADKSLLEIYELFTARILTNENRNTLLLFLELYMKALRDVAGYRDFFNEVLINWIHETASVIEDIYKDKSAVYATIMVSFYRGLMLDWLATNDMERILESQNTFVSLITEKSVLNK
ncbi:MAG TPA: TetR/AcrR family transcriptional regulator [Spirochaetota bacterium]|nr:TetR/AcrR family transcriptional regulator [Spirochaetota bacterium]